MLEKKKERFPKTVADACQILSGWQNIYGNNPRPTKAIDGVVFTTTATMEEDMRKKILHVLSERKQGITQLNVQMPMMMNI